MAANRKEQIYSVVDAFLLEHDNWVKSPSRPVVDGDYFEAMSRIFDVYDASGLTWEVRESSPIGAAICELKHQMAEYDRIMDEEGKTDTTNDFCRAVETLLNVRRSPEPEETPMELVTDLFDQGVSDEQIARMFGLVHPHTKTPLIAMVARERRKPGSVPELQPDYESPQKRRLREADELAQSQYEKAEAVLVEERNKPSCPESPEQLFLEGVGYQQAARMLERPETDVHAQWVDFAAQDDLSTPEDATSSEALENAIVDDGEWSSYSDDDMRDLLKAESIPTRSNTPRKTLIAKLEALAEKQAG